MKSERISKKWPLLVTTPHSSFYVPADIRPLMQLSDHDIKDYADLFTDEIFDLPHAYRVNSAVSRLVTDLNRAPDHLIAQAELSYEGVVAAVTDHGKMIFKMPPSLKLIRRWIRLYHHPFHRKIKERLPRARFMIDGHSMRSQGPEKKPDAGKPRTDIVLGNREYATCSLGTTGFIKRFFEKKGYRVQVNNPFMGKYIMGSYASRHRVPGVQIEINRALYMNEKTLGPNLKKIQELNHLMNELAYSLLRDHLKILA